MKQRVHLKRYQFAGKFVLLSALAAYSLSPASASVVLGSAQSFAVMGNSTITNTGPTLINGNMGLSPGTSITGAGTITFVVPSSPHINDALATQAQADEATAYDALSLLPVSADLSGQDLGGLTLNPGVYNFLSSAQLTGILTLDAKNDPNALFVFLIASTLTTAPDSNVHVINAGPNSGLYWKVGSSATLDANTAFAGNILALTSITMNPNASITCGRAFAQNGAVTLQSNVISNDCAFNDGSGRSDFGSLGFSGGSESQVVPEPGTFALLGAAFLFLSLPSANRALKNARRLRVPVYNART